MRPPEPLEELNPPPAAIRNPALNIYFQNQIFAMNYMNMMYPFQYYPFNSNLNLIPQQMMATGYSEVKMIGGDETVLPQQISSEATDSGVTSSVPSPSGVSDSETSSPETTSPGVKHSEATFSRVPDSELTPPATRKNSEEPTSSQLSAFPKSAKEAFEYLDRPIPETDPNTEKIVEKFLKIHRIEKRKLTFSFKKMLDVSSGRLCNGMKKPPPWSWMPSTNKKYFTRMYNFTESNKSIRNLILELLREPEKEQNSMEATSSESTSSEFQKTPKKSNVSTTSSISNEVTSSEVTSSEATSPEFQKTPKKSNVFITADISNEYTSSEFTSSETTFPEILSAEHETIDSLIRQGTHPEPATSSDNPEKAAIIEKILNEIRYAERMFSNPFFSEKLKTFV